MNAQRWNPRNTIGVTMECSERAKSENNGRETIESKECVTMECNERATIESNKYATVDRNERVEIECNKCVTTQINGRAITKDREEHYKIKSYSAIIGDIKLKKAKHKGEKAPKRREDSTIRITIEDDHMHENQDQTRHDKRENDETPNEDVSLAELQQRVEDTLDIMEQNVEKALLRGENLDELEGRADIMMESAHAFEKTAKKVKLKFYLRRKLKTKKWRCLIAAAMMVVITIMVLAVVFTTEPWAN